MLELLIEPKVCPYCTHVWLPRVKEPKCCPKCKRYFYWNKNDKENEEKNMLEIVIKPNPHSIRGCGKVGSARAFEKYCKKVWRERPNILHLVPLDGSKNLGKIMSIVNLRKYHYNIVYEIHHDNGVIHFYD